MRSSVRWRLVTSYLVVALTAAVVVGAVTYLLVGAYFTRQEQADLTASAGRIASRLRPFLAEHRDPSDLQYMAHALAFLAQTRVTVYDQHDKVLVDASPSAQGLVWLPPGSGSNGQGGLILIQPDAGAPHSPVVPMGPDGKPLDPGRSPQAAFLAPGGGNFRLGSTPDETATAALPRSSQAVQEPIVDRTDGAVLGYVKLSDGPAFGADVLAGLRLALAGGVAVAGLVALLAGLFTARGVTTPLAQLGAAAGQMAAGDLSARAPDGRSDEFGRLARQFNVMAERLGATIAALEADRYALRNFIADASHELRTPLTALKTFNQVLRQSPHATGDPEASFLAESAAQIDRLDHLTRALLDLSRLEAGLTAGDFVTEDLRPLVSQRVHSLDALADVRQIKLSLDLPEQPVIVRHDPMYLSRAVENLVGNALKFTPAGGQTSVGLKQTGDEVHLWVEDTGPGVAADEMETIFTRFGRGKAGQGVDGTGLGLAIVKAVAAEHGGRVEVHPLSPHGARFEITLPADNSLDGSPASS